MKNKTKRTLTPKLRFPEFRAKREWENLVFSDLYNFKPTNTFSRDKLNYETGTIRNIHYGDIHTRFQALFDVRKEIVPFVTPTDALSDFRESAFCTEGDMVFADASEDLADVGKSIEIIALHGERVLSGTHTILATRKDTQLIAGFGGHLFRSDFIRSQIRKEAQGSKVFGISPGHLANIEVCFPSDKTEQQKIADCLSSLDALMAAEGRKLEALRTHKKGLMQQLFPRPGETRPRLRFPDFQDAGEWEERALGELGEIITGKTPSTKDAELWGGGILFITPTDISEETKYQHSTYRTVVKTKGTKVLRVGTVVYTCIASIGKMALTVCPSITNQQINAVIPNKKTTGEFIYYALANLTPWIKTIPASSTLPIINKTEFSNIIITHPEDEAEQQAVVDCLSTLDTQITTQAQKITTLQTHKKGLMQQLFPNEELN